MRHALVFGATGQIGWPLVDRLQDDGWRVTAVSRETHRDHPGLHWVEGTLPSVGASMPDDFDVIFSCGPLDLFAQWYAQADVECPRVVAFGSTSIDVKRGSSDKRERDVAQRLRIAEQQVFDGAAARNAQATLLRPTLVYGAGRDHTLTRIAELALRWNRFVLPRNATGLREPVHVHDLADAAFAACDAPATHGKSYALPGGERLPYRDMVARVLAVLDPPPRLIEVPAPVFGLALLGARALGKVGGFNAAAVARMRSDLVFDSAPARNDFGYAPRDFRPTAPMFMAR
ncbi:RmlD substrate binding domain protein [Lysobacter dokdonensis DS-58]|uniref:RmlD substrate binding domain protein n=1 Tax=Lysobacter dokdonensis DS-58 TaxID=1300345 RepID=A0A0A2WJU6_9GAMM|nr:RmlD substrate binding domain protein [Lysobacter dokdonensis DS-58]